MKDRIYLYRHYKGGVYSIVESIAMLEATEETVVVYRSIENHMTFVRPADEFFADVEHEGAKVSRFTLIGSVKL